MRIIIRIMRSNVENSTQTIELLETADLQELRMQIQNELDIPISKQILKLKHDGVSIRLVNGFSFDFYEIKDRTVIQLEVISTFEQQNQIKRNQINKRYMEKLGMSNHNNKNDSTSTDIQYKNQLPLINSQEQSNQIKDTAAQNLHDKNQDLFELKSLLENQLKQLISYTKEGNLQKVQEILFSKMNIALQKEYQQEIRYFMNVIGPNGWNAMHYACYLGQIDIVSLYIKRGATLNKLSLEGWTPLQLAIKKNHLEVVKMLINNENIEINLITPKGSGLHIAARQGKIQILNLLLNKKANPLLTLQNGQTCQDVSYNQEIYLLIQKFIPDQNQVINVIQKTPVKQTPYKLQGYLHKVGRFQIALNYRYFVLDPVEGTLFRCLKKEDYPDRPLEIVSLRDIFSIQRIKKSWYMKNNVFFFEIQYSSRMCLGALNENIANIWVSSIFKSCIYANQIHEFYIQENNNEIIQQDKPIEIEIKDLPANPIELKSETPMFPYRKFVISEFFSFKQSKTQQIRSSIHGKQKKPIMYKSFDFLKILGQGSFGKVYMVRKKETGQIYAAKVLKKSFLAQKNLTKYALAEARILNQQSECPFLLKIHYAFQTQQNLYMILDFCDQGDLFQALIQCGYFEENVAKFYIAELIIALEQLHDQDIIYRDLKPENLLIKDGHIILADFGLCKEGMVEDFKTKSFCGSGGYLSPELLQNQGTDKKSDIYGVGIILFELLTGESPFYHHNNKIMFKQIIKNSIIFPRYVSQLAQDFITKLIQKNPADRPQWNEIKNDPFFEEVDWNKIVNKQYETPQLDTEDSNFSQGRVNFIDYDYKDTNNQENYIYGFDINTGITQ